MEWWLVLIVVIGGVMALILTRLPVAFCFLIVNLLGAAIVFGGVSSLSQIAISMATSVSTFTLIAIPLFIFLGEVTHHSGMGMNLIDALGMWMGKLPGRLSVLTIAGATMFGALSGSAMATTAMLGTTMVPEMSKRGYHKSMIIGPIVGSGGLAMIIPPSSMAVLLGALANISIAKLLISGILPGVLIGGLFIVYVVIRSALTPSLAPAYRVQGTTLPVKLQVLVRDVLPLGLIFFMAVGVIFLGVATATEAAALGALSSVTLAIIYRKFSFDLIKKATIGTVRTSAMIFLIISASTAFTQILNFTGATKGLVETVNAFQSSPTLIIIAMLLVVLILGCFIDQISIVMISIPLFMPIVQAVGFDLIAFGLLMLICVEMGNITPPFGLGLFVMKSVAPSDVTMEDIYKAALPFVFVELLAVVIIMFVPSIATLVPSLLGK